MESSSVLPFPLILKAVVMHHLDKNLLFITEAAQEYETKELSSDIEPKINLLLTGSGKWPQDIAIGSRGQVLHQVQESNIQFMESLDNLITWVKLHFSE